MWIADNWTDYELLDCGDGERLERWGKYTLRRPDPQAIWSSARDRSETDIDARYLRSSNGGGKWEVYSKLPDNWRVNYDALSFNVKLMNFKHTGLFPEQASNWDWLRQNCDSQTNVLNLFGYTGAASLACAGAGASVCHVDAAKGIVDHARGNQRLSGLEQAPIRWIVDDCREFVKREIRRGKRYNALIMDPPSYGRGTKGEIWKLEDDLYAFCKLCAELLADVRFILINSYTTGLSAAVLTYIAQSIYGERFGLNSESRELGLRAAASGLVLPAGASCRTAKGKITE
ncbi:MAG: class I SAM-dependent methyltransferase [Oscillospiraceae bacterium]|jgi:23S rRNA (cytosine1962-C5)-methyltransferase|nr:class I SAM-dependent methyltransferase [Oscillospiraceae bacterium]